MAQMLAWNRIGPGQTILHERCSTILHRRDCRRPGCTAPGIRHEHVSCDVLKGGIPQYEEWESTYNSHNRVRGTYVMSETSDLHRIFRPRLRSHFAESERGAIQTGVEGRDAEPVSSSQTPPSTHPPTLAHGGLTSEGQTSTSMPDSPSES